MVPFLGPSADFLSKVLFDEIRSAPKLRCHCLREVDLLGWIASGGVPLHPIEGMAAQSPSKSGKVPL
ncbi:hypothetical protein AAII07_55850, partial [Microvirga sp. 0TCS3.31]